MGFCNTSIIISGSVWIKQDETGTIIAWGHPWSSDSTADFVSESNSNGIITNSNPKIASLILHKATLLYDTRKATTSVNHCG